MTVHSVNYLVKNFIVKLYLVLSVGIEDLLERSERYRVVIDGEGRIHTVRDVHQIAVVVVHEE